MPTSVPTAVPTETPVPTAVPTETPVPTAVPTETPVPTGEPTAVPAADQLEAVSVPDIRDMREKDAQKALTQLKLVPGEKYKRCSELGVEEQKVGKGKIACQVPGPGTEVAPGTKVNYVVE
jgi:beta-lactam-binding protein with PASTA domain